MTLETFAIVLLAMVSAVFATLWWVKRSLMAQYPRELPGKPSAEPLLDESDWLMRLNQRGAPYAGEPQPGPMMVRLPSGVEVPIDSPEATQFLDAPLGAKTEGFGHIPERHPQLNLPPSAEELQEEHTSLSRVCGNCTYFDLEGGQEVFRQHPTFMKAASVVPPSEYARQAKYKDVRCTDCTGDDGLAIDDTLGCVTCGGHRTVPVPDGRTAAHFPVRARWSQFGLCELGQREPLVGGAPDNVIWSGHNSCDGRLFRIRLKRLA